MNKILCPECDSEYIIKDGNHKGLQGYRCKACKKKFAYGIYKEKINYDTKNETIKKEYYNKLFDLGHEWENIVEEVLKLNHKMVKSQKRLDNNKIADFMYDKTIVECKLSAGISELLQSIEKYQDHCEKLEIWSLNKLNKERISTNVSKEAIIDKMKKKPNWKSKIVEFNNKNINIEMLYYEDIIKKIKENEKLINKLKILYEKYINIQLNGGQCVFLKEKINIEFKDYKVNNKSKLDNEEYTIFVDNANKKKIKYKIENKYNRNDYINGILFFKKINIFRMEEKYYKKEYMNDYRKTDFLNLEIQFLNKGEPLWFDEFVKKIYLIDCLDNKKYKAISTEDFKKLFKEQCELQFIKSDEVIIQHQKAISTNIYFKIPSNIEPREFILMFENNEDLNISACIQKKENENPLNPYNNIVIKDKIKKIDEQINTKTSQQQSDKIIDEEGMNERKYSIKNNIKNLIKKIITRLCL